jgi:hypothetical protein
MPATLGVEILEQIHFYLDNNSLTEVARVSYLYHNSAIHVLWRILHSLNPLIRLLPRDAQVDGAIGTSVE